MPRYGLVVLLLFVIAPIARGQEAGGAEDVSADRITAEQLEDRLEGEFDAADIAAASAWAETLGLADWLGPLAPVALSPFFGVMCLSGLALWGPEWVTDNALLGQSGPLQNELVFFVFLGLALLTSLPRLTKVSKPFAQAVDRLETYAVIVILLVIKFVSSIETAGVDSSPEVAMIQLGVISVTLDTLLAFAMIVNVLVVNSVKFFFEFLIWLTPVPLVDAIFEVCNKTICATLMMVYAFSPTMATALNLVILLVAAILFRWINRRVRFYRTMLLDPLLSRVWPSYGQPKMAGLIVFPKATFGPFKDKSRLRLKPDGDAGWILEAANWWLPAKQHRLEKSLRPIVKRGWIMNRVEFGENQLLFSRRFSAETLASLAEQLNLSVETDSQPADLRSATHEFA